MATIQTLKADHVALTVTDPARSRAFYELLGFRLAEEMPTGFLLTNGSFMIGVRTAWDPARAPQNDRFDPNRVGLDHLALAVSSRSDLENAVRLAAEHGIECGEIVESGPEYVLMLKDPDGGQVELCTPKS
jgi:glyoxylase I family protein